MDIEDIRRRAETWARQVAQHPRVRQAAATAADVTGQLRTEYDAVRGALRAQIDMQVEDDTVALKRRLDAHRRDH